METWDLKFKLMIVINRDYEATLERTIEREYTRGVRETLKVLEEIYNLKITAIEHKVEADKKQKDIDVWDQEMQSKTHVYETIIERLEYRIGKTRKHREARATRWIDNKAKGQQGSGKFIKHQRKTT